MTTEGTQQQQQQQPTDEDLWNKVKADNSTQAEGANTDQGATGEAGEGSQQQGADGQNADDLAGLPEPTRKLIEGLRATAAEQAERLREQGQMLAKANGLMGNLKQRLDESQVTLAKIAPAAEEVEKKRKEAEKAAADARAEKRKKVITQIGDMTGLAPEDIEEVLPGSTAAGEGAAKPGDGADKPAGDKPAGDKPAGDASAKPLTEEQKIKILTLQRELSDRVPGWMKTRDTPEFKAWSEGPGKKIAGEKLGSWDPDVCAEVFKAFAQHKADAEQVAKLEKERQERLRRGESIRGHGTTTGNVDLSPDAAWNKVKRDRERARTNG